MASIAREKNGNRRILFVSADGRRPTIRLGKVSHRTAEGIKYRVEQLLEAIHFNRPMEADLMKWVSDLEPRLAKKLAAVGLIPTPENTVEQLGDFLAEFIARRSGVVKAGTLVNWGHTQRNLLAFFGKTKPLRDVSIAQARDFERYLKTTAREHRYGEAKANESLSLATIRKRISNAKMFFRDAVERGLIDSDPFAKLKGANLSNPARQFFVTESMTQKLMDACPDSQWRLIVALTRYGGVRCPSELVGLRFTDVDWATNRIRVTSPKTEHHEGKAERIIPLFPELRPHLEAAWHEAPEGTTHFITRYRNAAQNLRTMFQKIIHRAGLTPWPKLFQNLRSSRQTELEESYPSHVVCAWMGNSRAVAQMHYLQVTDEHFANAAQKAAQQALADDGGEPQTERASITETHELLGNAIACELVHCGSMGDEGFEPPASSL